MPFALIDAWVTPNCDWILREAEAEHETVHTVDHLDSLPDEGKETKIATKNMILSLSLLLAALLLHI